MKYLSDEEFITLFQLYSNPNTMSNETGLSIRGIQARRNSLEGRYAIHLLTIQGKDRVDPAPQRLDLGILNGTVLVFSDAHFFPGLRSTAYDGLIWAIKEFDDLKAVVANGDVFDGAGGISRHPRIGWSKAPSVIEELKACELAMGEIEDEAKNVNKSIKLIWPMGNHDARFETFLAANAPHYEHVKGFSLKDHFPAWQPCWSVWMNEQTVVKHRWKGGNFAVYNNTLHSGTNFVTGHLHSMKVIPHTNFNGTTYGVDTGTLANPLGPQFRDYTEEAPLNWRSGFAVLTFHKGRLLYPELVSVYDKDHIEFRGKVIKV